MLYDNTIPVFIHHLLSLEKLLMKGLAYTQKKKWSEKKLLSSRLAPDMFSLTQQVQYSYFTALEAATVLSGRPMPESFTYSETSVAELRKSLAMAVSFLKKIKRSELARVEQKKVQSFLSPKKKIPSSRYVHYLALPNFFFHVTTSYDILRNIGVPLKKEDYLNV